MKENETLRNELKIIKLQLEESEHSNFKLKQQVESFQMETQKRKELELEVEYLKQKLAEYEKGVETDIAQKPRQSSSTKQVPSMLDSINNKTVKKPPIKKLVENNKQ